MCPVQKTTQLLRGRARIKTQGRLVLVRLKKFGRGGDRRRRCRQGSTVTKVRSLGSGTAPNLGCPRTYVPAGKGGAGQKTEMGGVCVLARRGGGSGRDSLGER